MIKSILLTSATLICLGIISEAMAKCEGATATTAGTDEENKPCGTWDCGAQGSNVTCTLAKGTLTISGEGAMKDYGASWTGCKTCYPKDYIVDTPWSGSMVKKAVIEEGVSTIGTSVFLGEIYLTEVSGMENVKKINQGAFNRCTNLTSISLPNVIDLGPFVFHMAGLQYVEINKDANFGGSTFRDNAIMNHCTTNPETDMKTCGSCGDKYVKAGTGCVSAENCGAGYYADEASKKCLSCGDKYVKSGTGCVTAENCGAGYYADETSKRCLYCPYGKVGYKGQCLDEYPFAKKRYTPSEAAQWLNEDNNTITLTFKKQ